MFNNWIKRTYKISQNHGKECVEKKYCEDFELCSFKRPELRKNTQKNQPAHITTRKNVSEKKKYDPKITVEKGNKIIVSHLTTKENFEIHVTDEKNPFYLKQLKEVVLIKREKYIIESIKKR